jgi:serine/threonine protein kinase
VKAKAALGIALGLRFAQSLGLLHGAVKASNVLFEADQRIQTADFSLIGLDNGQSGTVVRGSVSAFASLLPEIAIGRSTNRCAGGPPLPARVPAFFPDDGVRDIAWLERASIVCRHHRTADGAPLRNNGER